MPWGLAVGVSCPMRHAIVFCVERVCVGCVWRRRAVGIGPEHVVWVVCSVAVPWGLVGARPVGPIPIAQHQTHPTPLGVSGSVLWGLVGGAYRFRCVWCPGAVGIGGGSVVLGVSGFVVPWGLPGGVSCLVVLGVAVSCQVVSCRVMSCRVV